MSKKRRENARKAYEESLKKEKAREKKIKIFGGLGVLVLVLGIIGVAFVASKESESEILSSGGIIVAADANHLLPPSTFTSGNENEYGVLYPYSGVESYNPNLPTLEVWLDYQCPACAEIEKLSGNTFKALADEGVVNLVYRPSVFLDANRRNDSSQRSVNAWGCAIELGKGEEYKSLLLENQPEGTRSRWNNSDFSSYASKAGLTGSDLESFEACVSDGRYLGWAANSNVAFELNKKTKTPTVVFNGVEVDNSIAFNPEALVAYIDQNR